MSLSGLHQLGEDIRAAGERGRAAYCGRTTLLRSNPIGIKHPVIFCLSSKILASCVYGRFHLSFTGR
jgi:hypothetical protein